MRPLIALVVLTLPAALAPSTAVSQGLDAGARIAFGHVHLNVTNVDAHKKFWATGLGGTPARLGKHEVVAFPHGLVVLTPQPPTAGSKGSVLNHIGLYVQNLRETIDRLRANGFSIVAEEEWPRDARTRLPLPSAEFRDGIGFIPTLQIAASFVIGPDGAKVELVEKRELPGPADMGHLHFFTPVQEGAAWYEKVLGGSTFPGPPPRGVHLNRDGPNHLTAQSRQAGTRGRVYDHVGFEVRNLDELTRRLTSLGIELERPQGKGHELDGVRAVFLKDPWDAVIELTEGLRVEAAR